MLWHASLYRLTDNGEVKATLISGATLISETLVVAAAHCVWNVNIEQLRIALGNLKGTYDDDDDLTARYYDVWIAFERISVDICHSPNSMLAGIMARVRVIVIAVLG